LKPIPYFPEEMEEPMMLFLEASAAESLQYHSWVGTLLSHILHGCWLGRVAQHS